MAYTPYPAKFNKEPNWWFIIFLIIAGLFVLGYFSGCSGFHHCEVG